jgi:hypothetical protein
MGLITETNAQYYSGQQSFSALTAVVNPTFTCTFNTNVVSAYDSTGAQISEASNYTIFLDNVAQAENISYISDAVNNIITLTGTYTAANVYIQLKQPAINKNYNSYAYISLKDVVNNFIVGYVGVDKIIPRVKRSDVIFHAKRGLQEFSYDTLKSIKSQELTIPPSLSVPIPQDYVNYVRISWVDNQGVQRIIYPVNNTTTNPYTLPIQDGQGIPTQNAYGQNNLAEQSEIEKRWQTNNTDNIVGDGDMENMYVFDYAWWKLNYGRRFGLEPQITQENGWFSINERLGTFSFSSDLADKLIVLEYISDGLAYDLDTKIPKMAEDAMYAHIAYSIMASRTNVQEFQVARFKRDRSAKLRNAKIRLSNIKLGEIAQVMRGKSKWIKH